MSPAKSTLRGLLLATTVLLAHQACADTLDIPSKSEVVAGLTAKAEIIVDHAGISHIYAANDHDAFFVQGWNAARDRLWQIDLWRKRGLGLLSQSFGPAYVDKDEGARLLLFRGDVTAEWAEYGAEIQADTEAFVDGINAYVTAALKHPDHLPIEFKITKSLPQLWSRDDVVRIRSGGLSANIASEVQRARVACAAGVDPDKYRVVLQPDHTPVVPDGLDPCSIPIEVMRLYQLGTQPVTFVKDKKAASLDDLGVQVADLASNGSGAGSNNWVIAPSHSETGRPILANDPHRDHALPSLRYLAHLSAPGLDVIGAGEPSLPGVTIGHNQRIAFGFTISNIDQEDLYVYDLDPKNPDRYRYGSGFETMKLVQEMIPVRGEAARPVTLRYSRHGAVLYVDAKAGHAYALRTVWDQPGATPYFASMLFTKAANWADFSKAVMHWHSPPNNQVFADVDGNIGWTIGASSPVRPNWDGLLPVPGDGRYEWAGYMDPSIFPHVYNPPEGFLATANDWDLPADFPMAKYKIGYEWASYSRITRIKEMLTAKPKLTLADSMALQTDTTSATSRRIVAQLPAQVPDDPVLAQAAQMLKSWNNRADVDSAAAALYEVWTSRHLPQAVMAELVPAPARDLVGAGFIDATALVLEGHPLYAVTPEMRSHLDQVIWTSLRAAWDETVSLLGSDPARWAWGNLHHAWFHSAVSVLADPATAQQLDIQDLAMGGTQLSPMAGTYRKNDFSVRAGASIRLVMDVGDWDNSRAINSSGQSGDPYSPYYRNLAPLWTSGEYVPLPFSRAAVEKEAAHKIELSPN